MILLGVAKIATFQGANIILPTLIVFAYVFSGFKIATSGRDSSLFSFLHSYFAAFMVAIYLSKQMDGSILLELLALPFIVDAIYGIGSVVQERAVNEDYDRGFVYSNTEYAPQPVYHEQINSLY
jgi:hypothetical protein